jgi:hypothetical protein
MVQFTLYSAVKSKAMKLVGEEGNQLLRRVGLAVGLMEVSGGMHGRGERENKRVLSVE